MRNLDQVGSALRAGVGLALLAVLVLSGGCVSGEIGGAPDPSDDQAISEAVEALLRVAPVGIYNCTLAGGLLSGSMVAYPGPWGRTSCSVFAPELPGSSRLFCSGSAPFTTCPDCNDLRTSLACPFR